jgi:hypothetical protein
MSSIVFRNGLVLTMDDQRTLLDRADVLVVGERIWPCRRGPSRSTPSAAS